MRKALATTALLMMTAAPAFAAAADPADGPPDFLTPEGGLMIWTLLIFLALLMILSRFAFKPILAAVEAREASLQEAIESARRDREEAARLLEEQRQHLEAARADAQRLIVEGRQAGEKVRAELVEQARLEQQDVLERARREIGAERDRAIADLRREAVDLAILGASRVIERNMDDQANRQLVESYLGSLATNGAGR